MKKREKIFFLPINELLPNPYQPRTSFDDDALVSLAESIKQYGILQPLCVRARDEVPRININGQGITAPKFEILSGERRWRAAKKIGLSTVPCIIKSCEKIDMPYIAFSENIFREDLSFFDVATSLQDMLMMSNLTQTELSKKLAISQSAIANKLRLLKLTPAEREKIINNSLTERHARAFIKVNNQHERENFINKSIEKKWSVSETETKINNYLNPKANINKPKKHNITRIGKINDLGIFHNSIDNAIRLVKEVGVKIEKSEKDYDDRIEIVLSIKKSENKLCPALAGK